MTSPSGTGFHRAPVVETSRLRLRPFRLDDLEASLALWTDPIVYRHILGRPNSREECWSRLLRYHGHWDWFGYGFWAIEHKDTGRMIGETGFADFQRSLVPQVGDRIEMGWLLSPAHHGQGLAREAVSAAIGWGELCLPSRKTACIISESNGPSIRLAQKSGFIHFADTTYNGDRISVFHRG